MVRRPSQQERIEALLAAWEPQLRDAFLASIRDIVDRARLADIIASLESGDLEGALRAVHVEPAAFLPLDIAIRQAFVEAGTATAVTIPRAPAVEGQAVVVFRFDVRNLAAETWLQQHSSTAIVEIVEDQRVAIRTALQEGMTRGDNPRTTALDVIGRVNPQTGRREGGIAGLTSQQAGYVASARAELASGDAKTMRNYLTRERRDKRFDAVVLKAIKAGKPVDGATVSRLAGRYGDRLLALRGETIGRTESMASINQAHQEAYRQAVEKGTLRANLVRRVWVATRDGRTRDSHRKLNGDAVGLNERFSNGLMFPGDPSGPAAEIANCRCRLVIRIDRFSNLE